MVMADVVSEQHH